MAPSGTVSLCQLSLLPSNNDVNAWEKYLNLLKKLLKEDGCLETMKVFLVWLIDTVDDMIELPPHHLESLMKLLTTFLRSSQRCLKQELYELLKKLHSITVIPGSVRCLLWLQEQSKESGEWIQLNTYFHNEINNFQWLTCNIGFRPTQIVDVLSEALLYIVGFDAVSPGMGRAWLPGADLLYLVAEQDNTLLPALDIWLLPLRWLSERLHVS